MSRTQYYFWVLVLLPICVFFLVPIHIGDLSIWVALGRDSLQQGVLVVYDSYTITPTAPMVYPAGASLLYAFLHRLGGLSLLVVFHSLIGCFWSLTWLFAIKRHRELKYPLNHLPIYSGKAVALFALAFTGASMGLVPRPALLATVPLLISYLLINGSRQKSFSASQIFIFCLLEVLWVNLHGSFPLLPLMILWQSMAFAQNRAWNLFFNRLGTCVAVLASALANPFGWKVFPYLAQTARASKARGLSEWLPTYEFAYPSFTVLFCLASAAILSLVIRELRQSPGQKAQIIFDPILPIWIAGLLVTRNMFLPYLLLPIFAAFHFNWLSAQQEPSKNGLSTVMNPLLVAVLVLTILTLNPFSKNLLSASTSSRIFEAFSAEDHAPKITSYLKDNPGPVFNDWNYGGDLALSQKNPYFIDSRNVIFSDMTFSLYTEFMADPEKGFKKIEKFEFQFFLIGDRYPIAQTWLQASAKFRPVLRDRAATLYQRVRPRPETAN